MNLVRATRLIRSNTRSFMAVTPRKIKFADTEETIYQKTDHPIEYVKSYFKHKTIAFLGYGPQGRAQALNCIDNGLNVIVGVRNKTPVLRDEIIDNKNIFSIEEATEKADVVVYLLSDAGQKDTWKAIDPLLKNKTLCFSHGFSIVYGDQTNVVPHESNEVILVAPKGTGRTLREKYVRGSGVNSSIAVHQDPTGMALETAVNLGFGIGSGYLYETTFQKEVYSDLYGERGGLMGAIHGLFLAQYKILRENGHSPSEAFNETVEEATQSLYPLIGESGMDWMYQNCSTTAQRGAIDWYPEFQKAVEPVFRRLYESVKDGTETSIVLKNNSDPEYRKKLNAELNAISEMEIWRAGYQVRKLRC